MSFQEPGRRTAPWDAYARSAAVVVAATAVAWLMFNRLAPVNIVMVYLLGVVFVAARYGRGPATLASVLSVAAFDFCFVPPYLSFAVSDTQYLVTFAVMLTVALLISGLTDRVRQQAEVARAHERRTAALYAMGREFAGAASLNLLTTVAARHIGAVFESEATVLLPNDRQQFAPPDGVPIESEAVLWAYEHDQPAGAHTDTLAAAAATYLPLVGGGRTVGVLRVRVKLPERLTDPEQFQLLETFASQTALAIERLQLAREAAAARLQAETEQMRSTLLSSVSHDLRTPLAVIAGITSSLLVGPPAPEAERRAALEAVYSEAGRLNRLVGNLLEMTRLESGTIQVHKEWQPLEEVVGAAVGRLDRQLVDRPLRIDLAPDLSLVPLDAVLIEQVLINLLDNALRYTPAGSPLDLSARRDGGGVSVELADRGAGLPPGEEERVFEKFYRVAGAGGTGGAGLGLAICRGMIAAHGGRIEAVSRPSGGTIFRFYLPIDGKPPALEQEEEQ